MKNKFALLLLPFSILSLVGCGEQGGEEEPPIVVPPVCPYIKNWDEIMASQAATGFIAITRGTEKITGTGEEPIMDYVSHVEETIYYDVEHKYVHQLIETINDYADKSRTEEMYEKYVDYSPEGNKYDTYERSAYIDRFQKSTYTFIEGTISFEKTITTSLPKFNKAMVWNERMRCVDYQVDENEKYEYYFKDTKNGTILESFNHKYTVSETDDDDKPYDLVASYTTAFYEIGTAKVELPEIYDE